MITILIFIIVKASLDLLKRLMSFQKWGPHCATYGRVIYSIPWLIDQIYLSDN